MTRTAYVNGRYLHHGEAAVHVEDRGYQFADGVYEVLAIHQGRPMDLQGHMERLGRSLGELGISWPVSKRALSVVMNEVIRKNRLKEGFLYLQITRGVAPRNHAFPKDCDPSLVMTVWRRRPLVSPIDEIGVEVITIPDIRWRRCDIKSVSLLPNVLGKQQAVEAGAYEAWMVDSDGYVTEGTSSNAWIVTPSNQLITRDASRAILNGITRLAVLGLAQANSMDFVERAFTVEEAKGAKEAFVTSTTSLVKPVASIDGTKIGDGGAGPLSAKIAAFYAQHLEGQGSAA
ncbi:MAG: D-amino-acid transaminase [Rhodospirillales bacterium]